MVSRPIIRSFILLLGKIVGFWLVTQPEFRATLLAPIGIGLCLGYSSGAIESIKEDPNIDPTTNQISWFGSILTVGAAIGSLLSGNTIDKMGRKFHILLGNLCFVIGWLLIIVDKTSMELAIVGRLVGGLGVGIVAIAVPTYIGEVSPPDVRGTLGSAFQLLVTGTDIKLKTNQTAYYVIGNT